VCLASLETCLVGFRCVLSEQTSPGDTSHHYLLPESSLHCRYVAPGREIVHSGEGMRVSAGQAWKRQDTLGSL
jgi:hypothetical protein